MLSAPRLSLRAGRSPSLGSSEDKQGGEGDVATSDALVHWHSQARAMIAKTENVGERFASEARAMHEGELAPRPIRGVASAAQVKELVADGVEVLALPPSLVEPLH